MDGGVDMEFMHPIDRRTQIILPMLKEETERVGGSCTGPLHRYLLWAGYDIPPHIIDYDLKMLVKDGLAAYIYDQLYETVGPRHRAIRAFRTF